MKGIRLREKKAKRKITQNSNVKISEGGISQIQRNIFEPNILKNFYDKNTAHKKRDYVKQDGKSEGC